MKFLIMLAAGIAASSPVLALETEEIGRIEARFGDKDISQPTLIARNNGEEDATAFMMFPGGGFADLSIAGVSLDSRRRLDLNLTYMSEAPGPETVPLSVDIAYTPEETNGVWTSDEAGMPPVITFTTLTFEGDEGRAAGSFTALLCFAEDYDEEPDSGNCQPIEGRFDTRFAVER